MYEEIRKITRQKQGAYSHHFRNVAVSSVIIISPAHLFLANAKNCDTESIIYRWTFDPMTYSSFNTLAVATYFMVTATLFSISSTLIIRNWTVIVSKVVVENIQS